MTPGAHDTSEVKTSIEWLRPDGERGFQEDCGARLFGGEFTSFAKKSFRLYFKTKFGAAKLKYPVFAGYEHGLAAADQFDQLELRSVLHDMAMLGFYMSNIFADDTRWRWANCSARSVRSSYLNGTYWGNLPLARALGADMHQRYLGGSAPITNHQRQLNVEVATPALRRWRWVNPNRVKSLAMILCEKPA